MYFFLSTIPFLIIIILFITLTATIDVVLPEDIIIAFSPTGSATEGSDYEDIKGYCKSATLEDVKKHKYVLTSGRYVGIPDEEDDGRKEGRGRWRQ